ncbi:MAG: hydantoinase/oxoprolinase family protein [Desulfobacteraceae bacterium]|nr:hydantoinase/oxoprolinase family protein [Desulfobacteraceae bacterium]
MIIGIDVGGTHTDGVLLSEDEIVKSVKIPTKKDNLYESVITAIDSLIENTDPSKIKRTVLSTTLTTNAVVQKKTSPVAVIVSAGPGIDPEFYKTGDYYCVVKGALDHRGRELASLDEQEIRSISEEIKKNGIKNIALISKFSPRNPSHENQMEKIFSSNFRNIFKGHNVSGHLNFPGRINTTWLNAAVHDSYDNFFRSVNESFIERKIKSPVHILKADGGTMPLSQSVKFPAQTIFSGPAASVMGAIPCADKNTDSIILDIGGTTTDIAVLAKGVPVIAQNGIKIQNIKTLIRAIETRSIGAGGDSFVKVENSKISAGPERKGPAMAFGGEFPTPTDAFVFLGEINDGDFEKAKKGIEEIAKPLGISMEEAAEQIIDITAKNIVDAFTEMISDINNKPVYTLHDFLDGYVLNPQSILVLGGPAGVFAKRIEKLSGIKTIPVENFSIANAKGAAMAKPTCTVTLFADTAQKKAYAVSENYEESIPSNYTREDAYAKAKALLYAKAEKMGADMKNIEIETIEDMSFNMIRGYRSSGKNIRITLQVRPGLVSE